MDDGNHILEFTLKGRVEVGAGLECSQAIAVGEFGEHADIAAVLELDACETAVRSNCTGNRSTHGSPWLEGCGGVFGWRRWVSRSDIKTSNPATDQVIARLPFESQPMFRLATNSFCRASRLARSRRCAHQSTLGPLTEIEKIMVDSIRVC